MLSYNLTYAIAELNLDSNICDRRPKIPESLNFLHYNDDNVNPTCNLSFLITRIFSLVEPAVGATNKLGASCREDYCDHKPTQPHPLYQP